jgi:hypothetical protein
LTILDRHGYLDAMSAYSAVAAPLVAAAATHYTAPWYVAVPVLVVALGLAIWRRRRGGPPG